MNPSNNGCESLSSVDLLAATHHLVRTERGVEAELLVHLGEIDQRKLYLDRALDSMFAFCVREFGFSEGAAYNRITVARAARRFPALIDAVRSCRVHLAGLRLLVPHLTEENHGELLARAASKSKHAIEELVATLAPKPAVAATVRKLPQPVPLPLEGAATRGKAPAPAVVPLAEETYKVQFTADRALRDKLRQAQDLLRHRVPNGDLAALVDRALDALIEKVKKERFGVGRKARPRTNDKRTAPPSRPPPAAIKRAVYERDGGRCTFTDAEGNRCTATGKLELDHIDGFAKTREHRVDRIRLLCRGHNQHAADQMYGRAFMDRARGRKPRSTRPGTSSKSGSP